MNSLKHDIERLHHCTAAFVRTDHVTESMDGKVIWARDVQVFTLTDHPTATEGYAWREARTNGETETYAVVNGGGRLIRPRWRSARRFWWI